MSAPYDACDDVDLRSDPLFRNKYRCRECDVEWTDEWSCACDDTCPQCDVSLPPVESELLGHFEDDGEFIAARDTYGVAVDHKIVEANGWVEAGSYWSAMFDELPPGVKGCPCGRSQISAAKAVEDLVIRTNRESGTSFRVRDIAARERNY